MSKVVRIRDIEIGGGRPIAIQSMTNVDTRDEKALLSQIERLAGAGCHIVRVAIPDMEAAEAFGNVRKKTDVPLVCDIHFDYRLAISAIENGADKIRINPGNIGSTDRVRQVVDAAREREIPIRVGVNSGSLEKDILEKYGSPTADGLVESALRNLDVIRSMGYDNLVVSMKSSDVKMTVDAYIKAAGITDCPLHVGVTEAGTMKRGKIKSAAGIGAILLAGVGDTIRVSLTADPVEEVIFARELLESIGLEKAPFELVSCPTCGRTEIDLEQLAEAVESRLSSSNKVPSGTKIAVMGCVVNGPGEAREADFGICGGKGEGLLMKRGVVVAKVPEEELLDRFIELVEMGTVN